MNSSDSKSILNKTVHKNGYNDGEIFMYYFCLVLVVLPGFATNALALIFIIKDVRKAVFPAIVLLMALISSDLVAVCFTGAHMMVSLYVFDKQYELCAFISVVHTFFRMYSGILNALMSIDRVLAICAPYYYKRRIHVLTWKIGTLLIALFTALFSLFPVTGLGNVIVQRYRNNQLVSSCSTFSYQPVPQKKVYGALYGTLGVVIILIIVFGNSMVIRTICNMKKRIIPVNVEPSSSTDYGCSSPTNVTSFEIAFAKLMGCLALVYLICGTPMNILILLQLAYPISSPSVKGIAHFVAGVSYSVDPAVYILIRKTTRRRIAKCLRCSCKRNGRLDSSSA